MKVFFSIFMAVILMSQISCRKVIGGGSPIIPPDFSIYAQRGGSYTVLLEGISNKRFQITVAVTCPNITDIVTCFGVIFENGGSVLTLYTAQDACSVFSPSVYISTTNACNVGTVYNMNFYCINQTTNTATTPLSDLNAEFICLP